MILKCHIDDLLVMIAALGWNIDALGNSKKENLEFYLDKYIYFKIYQENSRHMV